MTEAPTIDPKRDLVLTRVVNAPAALLWKGWTDPEILPQWFAPRPWSTVACELDVRPGGFFRTVMRSPQGEEFPNEGCYLEVAEPRRLVFTDALAPGYRPSASPFFTAVVTLDDVPGGTRYTAAALHKDEADRRTHGEMGFLDGWSQCLDQLVEVVLALAPPSNP